MSIFNVANSGGLYMKIYEDVVIVGAGVSGLYCALNLPKNLNITIITKSDLESSDSYLAQGGICVLKDDQDYDSFFEDTMRAGHYKNREESVDIMIRSSSDVIKDLIAYGVDFEKDRLGRLIYTREGAHSTSRILFHKDVTGKEITSKLLAAVKKRPNIQLMEQTTMLDIVERENECYGVLCVQKGQDGSYQQLEVIANYTVLATGGLGGIYKHSTNFSHLTGDAVAICKRHGIELQDVDYIQIHPTTFYSETPGRHFLISESVRGEGAVLLDVKGNRFVDELLPRDRLTAEVHRQMEMDGTEYVMLSMENIDEDTIKGHFPNIYQYCLEQGYDVTKEPIPVVPAQHYFMGGVWVDAYSKTSMQRLYAAGETSCNGVHGKNRLASNSLLESLVFAKRAAIQMKQSFAGAPGVRIHNKATLATIYDEARQLTRADVESVVDETSFQILCNTYKTVILEEIERMEQERERSNNEDEC